MQRVQLVINRYIPGGDGVESIISVFLALFWYPVSVVINASVKILKKMLFTIIQLWLFTPLPSLKAQRVIFNFSLCWQFGFLCFLLPVGKIPRHSFVTKTLLVKMVKITQPKLFKIDRWIDTHTKKLKQFLRV